MSTESLRKTDTKTINNPQFEPTESKSKKTFLQISDLELNKIQEVKNKKQKRKICINNLQNRLRKKEVQSRNENRILYGLFISAVAVLFFAAT